MKKREDYETIRKNLGKIKNISDKYAVEITEIDLAELKGYANVIGTVLDVIESETEEKPDIESETEEKPDIESCIGKLSALRSEVLEMNMMCDFMEDNFISYTYKCRLKNMHKLLESLEDDIWLCESLLGPIDEED